MKRMFRAIARIIAPPAEPHPFAVFDTQQHRERWVEAQYAEVERARIDALRGRASSA